MRPSWFSRKTVIANARGCKFKLHRWQNLVFTFYSIRVECEELVFKTNQTS